MVLQTNWSEHASIDCSVLYLYTRSDKVLWVTRCLAINLTEVLQIINRHIIASQVQHGVQQCTGVAIAQHKSVAA
jgi:hypothetical protein